MSLIRLANTGLFKRIEAPSPDIHGEVMLFRTVLDRALIDTFSSSTKIRRSAKRWLNLESVAFREACDRALLDPELVYIAFNEVRRILGNDARFKSFNKKG
jgi:hypothetical protein